MDPDEVAHYELPHLDLGCFQIQLFSCFFAFRVKVYRHFAMFFLPFLYGPTI